MAGGKVQREKGIREIRPQVYEVQVHVGRDPGTGRLQQASRTTREAIRVARRLRSQLETQVAQGMHRRPESGPEPEAIWTLSMLLDEWVAHGEGIGRSPYTIDGYRRKVDRVIRPGLGDVVLRE